MISKQASLVMSALCLMVAALGCGGESGEEPEGPPPKDFTGDQRPLIEALLEAHDGPRGTTAKVDDLHRAVLTPESIDALKDILETDSENTFAWTTAAQLLATQGNPELTSYLLDLVDAGYHPERRDVILSKIPKSNMKGARDEQLVDDAFSHPEPQRRLRAIETLMNVDREKALEAALETFEDRRFPGRYRALKYLSMKDDGHRDVMLSALEEDPDSSLASSILGKARKEGEPAEWKDFALAIAEGAKKEQTIGGAVRALHNRAFVGDRDVLSVLRRLSQHKSVYTLGEGGGTVRSLALQALQYLERSQ